MVWFSHLFQNFPQFIVIHTVKGFGIVNKAEITSWQIDGKTVETVSNFVFWGAPKSLQMVIAAMKLKDTFLPWKEIYDQPRQHIEKQRHYFANGSPSSQGYGFSSSHVCM